MSYVCLKSNTYTLPNRLGFSRSCCDYIWKTHVHWQGPLYNFLKTHFFRWWNILNTIFLYSRDCIVFQLFWLVWQWTDKILIMDCFHPFYRHSTWFLQWFISDLPYSWVAMMILKKLKHSILLLKWMMRSLQNPSIAICWSISLNLLFIYIIMSTHKFKALTFMTHSMMEKL